MRVVAARILTFVVVLAAGAVFSAPACAQSALSSGFDHLPTGFPLTGAHVRVDCGSCHVNGRFKGTPRQCATCHNGTTAQGKNNQHPKTTNLCEQCHVPNDWRQVHVDHAAIVTGCASCHNGTVAVGKPVNHPVTGASCETCHKSTVSYAGAIFDHTGLTAGCASCHNGTSATGLTTPPHIPTATLECSNCHANTANFTSYTMNHTAVSGIACSSCHNGSFASEGTSGAQGRGGHVATTADCSTCHKSTTSWAGAAFTHAAGDTNCSSCHNGTTATGLTTPPHIPTGTLQCSNCHTNTAASFISYTMNHTAVTGIACSACHSGACQRGHVGRAGQEHGSRRDHGGLLDLPQEHDELGRCDLHPRGDRHQLLELPQRHDRDRHDDAAAHPDRDAPVQQLPHQYGGELYVLYDEPLRLRDRTVVRPSRARAATSHRRLRLHNSSQGTRSAKRRTTALA